MNEEQKHQKPAQNASRARKEPQVSKYVAKVFKKAAQIADLMIGEDVEQDLKVLRDAKKATHHVYDTKTKKLKKVPDHKTRLAATTLSRAYHEGKPVERSIAANVQFESIQELQAKLRQSPAFLEHISSQNALLAKDIIPALPEAQ